MALEKAPQFLSVLLVFTLPFLTQLKGLNPLFPKFAVTQIIVYLILGSWALKAYFTGRLTWVSSKALWILLAFSAWTMATIFISPFSKACLWHLRDDVVYPLWYLLLTFTCLEAWQAENLLVAFLVSGLATSLWALDQAAGMGGEGWSQVVKTQWNGRPVAGFGSPDFLAGYLLMVWPLALALWMRAERTVSKIFWGFLVTASLAALFLTGSVAGWVGLAAGTVVFGIFVVKNDGWFKAFQWLGLPLALTAASFVVPPMDSSLKEWTGSPSPAVRFQEQVWKGTVDMVQNHPMGGVGFGAFMAAFPSYRPAFLILRQAQRAYGVDHASNWALEWAAETGVVGLLLILGFWFYALAQWWKLYKANAVSRPLAVGAFAAIAAVAAGNLLNMDGYLPSIALPLLFLAAFPVALSQRFYRMTGFPIQRRELDISRRKIYFLPFLTALMALALLKVGNAFQRQGADLDLKKASEAAVMGNWSESLGLYDKALLLDPGNPFDLYERGSVYLDRNQPGDLDKALEDFNGAGNILPDYKLIHFQKYEVLLRLNRVVEAKEELRRAARLDPILVYLLDDFKKARSLASSGHLSGALMIYQNLYFDYPTCVPMIIDYANCFAMAGDYESAVHLYQQALRFDPENTKALYDLPKVQGAENRAAGAGKSKAYILGKELE